MRFSVFLVGFLCFSAVSAPVCSDLEARRPACAQPEKFLIEFSKTLNAAKSLPISAVIEKLSFAKGTVVGAHFSHSLQRSNHADNPRLYLLTECGPLTLTLYGKTLELAIVKQIAQSPIAGDGAHSQVPGQLLVDFGQFPRTKEIALLDSLNRLDPRFATGQPDSQKPDRRFRRTAEGKLVSHDTRACSSCHVDTGHDNATHTSLGQSRLVFDQNAVDVIISPYERTPGTQAESQHYCVQDDLKAFYDCKCSGKPASSDLPACRPFLEDGKLTKRLPAQDAEACARLKAVFALEPVQHCDFISPNGCLVNAKENTGSAR